MDLFQALLASPRYDVSNCGVQVQGNHVYRAQLPAPPPPPQYQQQHAKPPLALSAVPIPGINKEAAQVGTALYQHRGEDGDNGVVQDAHAKKQKEIRDLMKKRREKAVLVDRISRWLFPTSFILLNIVYWALFGDHDLW